MLTVIMIITWIIICKCTLVLIVKEYFIIIMLFLRFQVEPKQSTFCLIFQDVNKCTCKFVYLWCRQKVSEKEKRTIEELKKKPNLFVALDVCEGRT